ncbi:MAG: DNA polymerase III subunit delta' [Betaproteobacteria bacterium]|nr:DNA polymerase III subunit delta' [Betaproteobacteria bacterium]
MADDPDVPPPRAAWQPLPPWLEAMAADTLAQRERWPHAWLIEGARGIGKRALALELARSLLCESPRPGERACGSCPGCTWVAAGQHPDLRLVELVEFDEEGNATPVDVIKIDAIRRLGEWAQITSHRGGAKVAVVVPAERMNASAANALLKTLEEPPPGTYLLLVAHQGGRLPATVVSRCRRLPVPRPATDVAVGWLAGQGAADPATLLAQAAGAPLVALELADPALQAERAVWLAALAQPRAFSPAALAARIDLGGREERRERLAAAIDWLLAWTADLARVRAGGEARLNPDHAQALAANAASVARISLFRYYSQLLGQRTLLAHPLQPRFVAEALLVDYRALFA